MRRAGIGIRGAHQIVIEQRSVRVLIKLRDGAIEIRGLRVALHDDLGV